MFNTTMNRVGKNIRYPAFYTSFFFLLCPWALIDRFLN